MDKPYKGKKTEDGHWMYGTYMTKTFPNGKKGVIS